LLIVDCVIVTLSYRTSYVIVIRVGGIINNSYYKWSVLFYCHSWEKLFLEFNSNVKCNFRINKQQQINKPKSIEAIQRTKAKQNTKYKIQNDCCIVVGFAGFRTLWQVANVVYPLLLVHVVDGTIFSFKTTDYCTVTLRTRYNTFLHEFLVFLSH